MTEAQLRAARPNVAWTSSGLVDRITSRDANAFVFGSFPPVQPPVSCDSCRLTAVTMISGLPSFDTATYAARVHAIRERWSALAGAPTDSSTDTTPQRPDAGAQVTRTLRWQPADDSVLLLLRFRVDTAGAREAVRLVHATVYDPRNAMARPR